MPRRGAEGRTAAASVAPQHTTHARLEVDEQGPRDEVVVVCAVEEDVLAVARVVRHEVLQHAVRPDAVLEADLLPELHTDCTQRAARGG